MRNDCVKIEEERIGNVHRIEDYPSFHERHRIFPAVLKDRGIKKVIDIASGIGVVGKRIMENSDIEVICNDISPTCIQTMKDEGLHTVSFDIDNDSAPFPFEDNHFDAVISLASIEHVINTDNYLREIKRILKPEGYLYLSAPNYSGILYLLPFLISGRTFHNPLDKYDKYEFYAHVRYFTYRTLVEVVTSFGFTADTVYLGLPESGSRYLSLKAKSKVKAFVFRFFMKILYTWFNPRWCSEPVICFKNGNLKQSKVKKIVL